MQMSTYRNTVARNSQQRTSDVISGDFRARPHMYTDTFHLFVPSKRSRQQPASHGQQVHPLAGGCCGACAHDFASARPSGTRWCSRINNKLFNMQILMGHALAGCTGGGSGSKQRTSFVWFAERMTLFPAWRWNWFCNSKWKIKLLLIYSSCTDEFWMTLTYFFGKPSLITTICIAHFKMNLIFWNNCENNIWNISVTIHFHRSYMLWWSRTIK
jgi:hypothetical protein